MNSICIFAHFNKNNNLEDYVIDYLKTIKSLVDEIIFISTSEIENEKINLLNKINYKVIIKENVGYDFGSWREGLLFIKKNYKNIPKEIIFCNDSCYISKNLLKESITKMRKKGKIDFWGITKNYNLGMHIQTYFIVLNSKPLKDQRIWDFFNEFGIQNRKLNYIINYEIGLSKFLLNQKYNLDSYIKLNILKLLFLTAKYKFIFINDYLNNIIKYIITKKLIRKKSYKNIDKSADRKKNLFLKKRSLKDIILLIRFMANPINGNITHLDINDLKKINSPFLKVSEVKTLIQKEGLKKVEKYCKEKGFNYEYIVEHQLK